METIDLLELNPNIMTHTSNIEPINNIININNYHSYDTYEDEDYNDDDEYFEFFTKEEEGHLIENVFYIIESIIVKNPLIYNYPNYQELITEEVIELLNIQLGHIYEITEQNSEDFNEELLNIVNQSFKLFHKHILPKRSFKRTFIRKLPNTQLLSSIIDHLKSKPQPEQRSDEWYKFRYNTLTASNIWKAFGTDAVKNQLIYEKCNPLNSNKFITSIDTPMHWGQKYEPLSVMFYEKKYKTTIGEFGCILHDHYDFIAASPDGINIDVNSNRFGRMLEIKNIVNREMNGIPKLEYWIQMQVQMEVCNLNECDFLETKFVEYESKEEFDNDGNFNYTHNHKLKGIIMMFNKGDNTPMYIYPPLNLTEIEFNEWEETTMNKYNEYVWIRNIYWNLEDVSCVLVLRNKLWFNHAIHVLNDIWNIIKREKIEGFEHRAPKRKITKKNNELYDNIEIKNKCFINISTLDK